MSTKKPTATDKNVQSNSPAVAIFQWLTYVFWGVTAALSVALVAISTELLVNGYSSMISFGPVIFLIAATFVLLPLALTFDYFFSRHERDHKTGIGMVLMVLHAVLAALIAVTALAVAVYSIISLVVFSDDASGTINLFVSSAAAMLLFGLIFVRIMRPVTKSRLRMIVRSLLLLLVSGVLVWAIAGPATQAVVRQQDNRTLVALQSTGYTVISYVSREGSLPQKLEDALKGSAFDDIGGEDIKRSLDDGRLTYTPNVLEPMVDEAGTTFYYEVCATFDYADETRNQYTFGVLRDELGFAEGLDDVSIEAGETCYKMKHVKISEDTTKPM